MFLQRLDLSTSKWVVADDGLMLDFIESVLPVSPPGPAASDHNKTAKEVTRIVSAARDQAAYQMK
jgi:hypothetical protein